MRSRALKTKTCKEFSAVCLFPGFISNPFCTYRISLPVYDDVVSLSLSSPLIYFWLSDREIYIGILPEPNEKFCGKEDVGLNYYCLDFYFI